MVGVFSFIHCSPPSATRGARRRHPLGGRLSPEKNLGLVGGVEVCWVECLNTNQNQARLRRRQALPLHAPKALHAARGGHGIYGEAEGKEAGGGGGSADVVNTADTQPLATSHVVYLRSWNIDGVHDIVRVIQSSLGHGVPVPISRKLGAAFLPAVGPVILTSNPHPSLLHLMAIFVFF
ncbi:hypothetical protein B0H13DRAFT_1971342 [Mycena leptocephala]|nr:hypothetical protein B0H13DRAFT_1971342 [Mycena leptocephala]